MQETEVSEVLHRLARNVEELEFKTKKLAAALGNSFLCYNFGSSPQRCLCTLCALYLILLHLLQIFQLLFVQKIGHVFKSTAT